MRKLVSASSLSNYSLMQTNRFLRFVLRLIFCCCCFYRFCTAKPSITTFPQSVTIREGGNVTLQCNATGGSSLEISWSFRGSLMMKNGGVGNILTLSIVNVNRKYGGDYRCVVRSRIGNNTSTSALNVQCKYNTRVSVFLRN